MSISIAIIKPNTFSLIKEKYYKNEDLLEKDFTKYIEIVETTFKDMMELIVKTIGLTPQLMGDTLCCYETKNNIYQLCFLTFGQDSEKPEKNLISTDIVIGKEKIYGTTVLINSKINDDGVCSPDTVNIKEIIRIFYQKFIHKGIIIKTEGIIEEFEYFDHPLEYFKITSPDNDNYKKYPGIIVPFLNFNLLSFLEIEPKNNIINKKGTLFIGRQRIHGDIIIVSKENDFEFNDLDLTNFNKLLDLSTLDLKKRDIKKEVDKDNKEDNKEDNKDNEKINELPVLMNRFMLLEKRWNKYKKVCASCKNELTDTILVCSGCYRVKYHNEECRLKDWEKHKLSCLYNQEPLNEQIKRKINK